MYHFLVISLSDECAGDAKRMFNYFGVVMSSLLELVPYFLSRQITELAESLTVPWSQEESESPPNAQSGLKALARHCLRRDIAKKHGPSGAWSNSMDDTQISCKLIVTQIAHPTYRVLRLRRRLLHGPQLGGSQKHREQLNILPGVIF